MQKENEINSRICGNQLRSEYLQEKDLYFYRKETPRYRINIIGSGMMALEHMLVTYLEGRAEIRGIFDTSIHSLEFTQKTFSQHLPEKKLCIFKSLEDAVFDPEADALMICTPNYTHLEVLKTAIRSGKHIFLEKPMATTVEDAAAIVKMASEYPSVFQIGLQYRYKAIYVEARHDVLSQKSIGKVHGISIIEHRIPFLDKVSQWNKFSEYSGGTLVEKCCHYFDLFNLFAQSKPKSVFAVGGQKVNFINFEYEGKKADILDHAIVVVEYENGIQCDFNLCMFAPMFYEEITIVGEKWYEFEPLIQLMPHNLVLQQAVTVSELIYRRVGCLAPDEQREDIGERTEAILYLTGAVGSFSDGSVFRGFAHCVYYASTKMEKAHSYLHGEIVAMGVLVQFILQGKAETEIGRYLQWLSAHGFYGTFSDWGLGSNEEMLDFSDKIIGEMPDRLKEIYLPEKKRITQALWRAERYLQHNRKGEDHGTGKGHFNFSCS